MYPPPITPQQELPIVLVLPPPMVLAQVVPPLPVTLFERPPPIVLTGADLIQFKVPPPIVDSCPGLVLV